MNDGKWCLMQHITISENNQSILKFCTLESEESLLFLLLLFHEGNEFLLLNQSILQSLTKHQHFWFTRCNIAKAIVGKDRLLLPF